MGKLIRGSWSTQSWSTDDSGHFRRDATTFRGKVEEGGPHPPEAGRYHLYVSLACPWAHRTLIARALNGLEDAVPVSVVHPLMGDDGWTFDEAPGATGDRLFSKDFLREIYLEADPSITARVTVPVLWDRHAETIVNNESREIMRLFDTAFAPLWTRDGGLFDDARAARIDETIDALYDDVNNGVYRAGFATTQSAYEDSVRRVFAALDHWESVLSRQRFLCGEQMSEADICLFTTLVRFDPVYTLHFKCNWRRIVDYPNLSGFLRDVYQREGVAGTVDLDHIKQHYYRSHLGINPTGIVPVGPELDLEAPHDRG